MNVSLIFITWNRVDLLLRCLAEVPWQHPRIAECVLVDNGSSDGTVERVRAAFPDIQVIALEENRGVTAARNLAIARATGDLLLFLDDDGRFHYDCLDQVCERMAADPEVAVVSGVVHHFADEDIFGLAMQDFLPGTGEFVPAPSFKGGCCFIRRQAFTALGPFPDYYFYGCEELDFSLRVVRARQTVMRYTGAVLLHAKVVSRGRNQVHFRYLYRNRILTAWRNLPFGAAAARSATVVASGLVASLAAGRLWSFVRGMGSGLWRLPGVLIWERQPMSRKAWRIHRRRFAGAGGGGGRWRRFLADIRYRRGLDRRGTF